MTQSSYANSCAFQHAPLSVKENCDLARVACLIQPQSVKDLLMSLNNVEYFLNAVAESPKSIQFDSKDLQKNPRVVLAAVGKDPAVVSLLPSYS
jgi:hypothetical protein